MTSLFSLLSPDYDYDYGCPPFYVPDAAALHEIYNFPAAQSASAPLLRARRRHLLIARAAAAVIVVVQLRFAFGSCLVVVRGGR